jgi:hypothetical protein
MQAFYQSLDEKDRRRYAAIEAKKLGRGGHHYIMALFGCNYGAIRRGRKELEVLREQRRGNPA